MNEKSTRLLSSNDHHHRVIDDDPSDTNQNVCIKEIEIFVNSFNAEYESLHLQFENQFWGTKMALSSPPPTSRNTKTPDGDDNDNDDVNGQPQPHQEQFFSDLLTSTKSNLEGFLSDPLKLQTARQLLSKLSSSAKTSSSNTQEEGNSTEDSKEDSNAAFLMTQLQKQLEIIIKTCRCYDMSSSPEAKRLRQETIQLENNLESARNRSLVLGYYVPTSSIDDDKGDQQEDTPSSTSSIKKKKKRFVETSSVGLRNVMKTHNDETVRKSAYEALRSIGPFCLQHGFIDIIQHRIQLAKCLSASQPNKNGKNYEDFYDYKVQQMEGFDKTTLFQMLDSLEIRTRPIMKVARNRLKDEFGPNALEPWNLSYYISGGGSDKNDHQSKLDKYYPFSQSVSRLVRSYAALGVSYQQSTMNLDLLERKNKHDNGFCHWPQVAWIKPSGEFQPAVTNFTSCANPSEPGSGIAALKVLFHEAGHAAHFANIKQPSPLFSQERAPTSAAYAENQSMFLDSLVDDCAWKAIYATRPDDDDDDSQECRKGDTTNRSVPFELLEKDIRCTHPYRVLELRGKLSVSYFEKALYELPIEELTAQNIFKLADAMEIEYQDGLSIRPILAYPHIISDEASCYYHSYILAEMSVHQTRDFFKNRDGYIVNNSKVGPTLQKAYWECGNSRPFLELVKDLTGEELSGDAWINSLQEDLEEKVQRERQEYDDALLRVSASSATSNVGTTTNKNPETTGKYCLEDDRNDLDNILNMTIKFVDGDALIADSSSGNGHGSGHGSGILGACRMFEEFVQSRIDDLKP